MYVKRCVGLEEALGAIQAMLAEVRNHPNKYWQHACLAIVDGGGKLVAFAKMDGPSETSGDIAIRKARTAALWRRNISEMNAWLADRDWGMENYIPGSTAVQGGVVIADPSDTGSQMKEQDLAKPHDKSPEEVEELFGKSPIGAIGVSAAGPWQLDLEVANVGLKYIQNKLWPQK